MSARFGVGDIVDLRVRDACNPRGPSERVRVRVTAAVDGGSWSGVLERDTSFRALRRGDVLSFAEGDVVAVTTRLGRAVEALIRAMARWWSR